MCRVLSSAVKELVERLAARSKAEDNESLFNKCLLLNEKLDAFIRTLDEESQHVASPHEVVFTACFTVIFRGIFDYEPEFLQLTKCQD